MRQGKGDEMSLVCIGRKLSRKVKPYETVVSEGPAGEPWLRGTYSIPPEIAWLRTYCTYNTPQLYGNTNYLMYKNLGMLISRINIRTLKCNGIHRYHTVRIFK